MNRSILLSGAILGAFGILGSALVSLTYEGTKEQIAANERAALMRQIHKLVPKEQIDNDPLQDVSEISAPQQLGAESTLVYRARKNGEPVAVILSPVQAKGYAGPIKLIVAIYHDGTLGGVRVLSHRETPGLGDKIEESRNDWITHFAGRSLENPKPGQWKVKKDSGVFDQFTGATITPRLVVAAVKGALEYFQQHRDELFHEENNKGEG